MEAVLVSGTPPSGRAGLQGISGWDAAPGSGWGERPACPPPGPRTVRSKARFGKPVSGDHLEADMVTEAVERLAMRHGSVLMIENVGNLVCPEMSDLGERMKVAVTSVTEGEDKPLRYPFMFRAAGLVVLNRTDLASHVDFDHAAWLANVQAVSPAARVISLSARTSDGLEDWYDFLRAGQSAPKGRHDTHLTSLHTGV